MIRADVPDAALELLEVDLADLTAVRRAAETAAAYGPIDVLVNNAGVMGVAGQVTADGLDLQLATNHFGPFLLTGLLLPSCWPARTPESSRCRRPCTASPGGAAR